MQIDLSHNHRPVASAANDVAVQKQPVPPEVLLDLARSLFLEYHRLLEEKSARIAELERRLTLVSLMWRPAGTIVQ
jgi:hypothetical protein